MSGEEELSCCCVSCVVDDVSSLVVRVDTVDVSSFMVVFAVDATLPGLLCRKRGATPPRFFRFGVVADIVVDVAALSP